jgi:hypothetical protein
MKGDGISSIDRLAQCHCGPLRVNTSGDPPFVMACHCQAWQRRPGSALQVGAYFNQDLVRVEGPSNEYVATLNALLRRLRGPPARAGTCQAARSLSL